jgi:hypothetical protein
MRTVTKGSDEILWSGTQFVRILVSFRRAEQEVGSLVLTESNIDSVPIDGIDLCMRKNLCNSGATALFFF